jgi:hypothetical protein
MVPTKLLHRVETHWQAIATAVVDQMQTDPKTPHHQVLDEEEIRARAHDLIHNLGVWLTTGDDTGAAKRSQEIGRTRHAEGIPLSEAVYKLQLLARKTIEYVQAENPPQTAIDLYSELEMLRALQGFFATVIYNVVVGYEQAAITTRAAAWAYAAQARAR